MWIGRKLRSHYKNSVNPIITTMNTIEFQILSFTSYNSSSDFKRQFTNLRKLW